MQNDEKIKLNSFSNIFFLPMFRGAGHFQSSCFEARRIQAIYSILVNATNGKTSFFQSSFQCSLKSDLFFDDWICSFCFFFSSSKFNWNLILRQTIGSVPGQFPTRCSRCSCCLFLCGFFFVLLLFLLLFFPWNLFCLSSELFCVHHRHLYPPWCALL